jgi:mRNA-degrading endonuclease toxin of MazEF toxin-antitoxin module
MRVKSIDFRACKAERIGRAPESVLEEVLSMLDACIY